MDRPLAANVAQHGSTRAVTDAMRTPSTPHCLAFALAALFVASARPAHACGGCFSPPRTVQTVTYHRMALSVSTTQTTLWDQFGYSGNPSEFSWILPILGGPSVTVQLADVRFLAALDDDSAVVVPSPPSAPRRECPVCYTPPPPVVYSCADTLGASRRDAAGGADGATSDASFAGGGDSGVSVLRQEAVGPYDVVVLRGTDAMALRTWLTDHNYVVPATMEPVLDHYVALHMDFVALRLQDGAGLGSMQPVRVTAPGYQPLLPLRMVAAGVADSVELVLFTLADSRMEPLNFRAIEIGNTDLSWDFGTDSTSIGAFRRAERALAAAAGGRAWLTESAATRDRSYFGALAQSAAQRYRSDSDAGAGTSSTPTNDMAIAMVGLAWPVLTRLHAQLAVGALDSDLQLSASTRNDHPRGYQFGRVENVETPAACGVLHCATGLVSGGEGQITDPFGAPLAPETVLPSSYTRGSLPAWTSRFNWRPRHADGTAYTPPAQEVRNECGPSLLRCSANVGAASRRSAWAGVAALVVAAGVVRQRRAKRRAD